MSADDKSTAVALVTGAGSGIGRETALHFAKAGCSVVAADVNKAGADETCTLIQDAVPGAQCKSIHCDVTQPEQVEQMVQEVKDAFGRLDYAFNNAGIISNGAAIHELAIEDWDRVLSVNLRGQFLSLKYEIPLMLATSPSPAIVLTSSVCGHKALPGMSAYGAAKFGVRGLAQVAALEYGPRGLRVNTVSPGDVETPMIAHFLACGAAADVEKLIAKGATVSLNDGGDTHPDSMISSKVAEAPAGDEVTPRLQKNDPYATRALRRIGKPSEVAQAVVWLCMRADYITGTDLIIDGGALAKVAL